MKELQRRIGEFSLPACMIKSARPELLKLMGNFLIVQCEHEFMFDRFVYHAYSPLFDEVPEAYAIPVYDIKEKRDVNGMYTYSVLRRSS